MLDEVIFLLAHPGRLQSLCACLHSLFEFLSFFLVVETFDSLVVTLESGKPIDVVEKMIEGRIRKFLEEIVLLEQPFVIDGKTKIKKVVEELKSKNNCNFSVSGYIRYEIGE